MDTLNGYVTPEEVANRLGMRTDDLDVLADIKSALLIIEAEVEQYCQTTFAEEAAATELYNGTGSNILSLRKYCRSITSIKSIDVNGVKTDITKFSLQPRPPVRRDGDGTKLYTYVLLKDNAEFSEFPEGLENIEVIGNFGMVAVPATIKEAICLGVKNYFDIRIYNEQTASETGFGRSVAQRSGQRIEFLPSIAMSLLDIWKYRGFDA